MDGLEFKRQVLGETFGEKGQSLVEYILLLAVVASFVTFFFKTNYWESYFGDEGKFESAFRGKLEYSYRHSLEGNKFFSQQPPNYGSNDHDSYNGRFFKPNTAYPVE